MVPSPWISRVAVLLVAAAVGFAASRVGLPLIRDARASYSSDWDCDDYVEEELWSGQVVGQGATGKARAPEWVTVSAGHRWVEIEGAAPDFALTRIRYSPREATQ